MNPTSSISRDWLEKNGLGEFACGMTAGIRTRRDHASLLIGQNRPSGSQVIVNGCDATAGEDPISAQQNWPDVVHRGTLGSLPSAGSSAPRAAVSSTLVTR